jgi:single-stranded-DNA-specific exonuclease
MTRERTRPRWHIAPGDRAAARELAAQADIPPIIAQLLLLRGVNTPETAKRFLNPLLAHLEDPFLLTDLSTAVARITRARDNGEAVLVFGDYDVDGIAATALLSRALHRFGVKRVEFSMPDRLREGYGLMPEQVEHAKAEGFALLITVDNGISSFPAAQRAQELGIDLLITDHHNIESTLPPAVAVVNPKREAPGHPLGTLCGAGVALKLSAALNGTHNDLDIAALGTVADMVPLLGENRAIVALGLKHMAKHRRVGLAKLAAASSFDLGAVTSEKIGFQLSPRLNAAGRLDDARVALDLLMTECPDRAREIAAVLDAANGERREIEKKINDEAVEELDAFFRDDQRSIVVARKEWHAGVIGIVASRLLARYHRPVIILSIDGQGMARGSARASGGFDMMAALTECRDLLVKFGGHRAAAGMTLPAKDLGAFRERFELAARAQLGTGLLVPELAVDAITAFSEIDQALLRTLERLEPFGQGNPAPLFATMAVEIEHSSVRVLKDQHVKMTLRQGGTVFSAIWYRMAERFLTESLPALVDVAFTPQFSSYSTDTPISLLIRDIRPSEA